ncbi:porin family protein [Bradyrhizobium forestalis]|uniref:Porin family protein n=1 Tax=Bradyrhizobium forestalis TaxID=1419263 RepID=A0A2M8R1M4_9BRAD|nr:outer membrane beta-barrel protein [Bradyrhizobium forestalis]PJG51731.1 porin family protein [Bradyrhizobium forestalis]
MKRLLLATSALIAAGSAQGADLGARPYTKAPVVAAVPFSWTGCYVGGHVGGGWSRTGFTDPGLGTAFPGALTTGAAPGDRIGVNGDGVVGGAQLGCDYQFASNWVVGIAGDFTWSDIHGVSNDPFFAGKSGAPATLSSRTDWLASITGRVGYSWDRVLVYGKGGVGFTRDRYDLNNFNAISGAFCVNGVPVPCNSSASVNRTGWVVGVGVEWAFAPNWSALVEYDHYGFDSKRINFAHPFFAGVTAPIDIRQDIDIVKVGINYRFGGSPVVAKY